MRRRAWIGALLLTLIAGSRGAAGEPPGCEPCPPCFLQRVGPVGGWFPYGGGLLHWWDPHCFPDCGGPDDYCRKTLPLVCRPPCPSCCPGSPPPPEPALLPRPSPGPQAGWPRPPGRRT